jgi:3-oxoacyl-[acyl-carrier-protein] synthase II
MLVVTGLGVVSPIGVGCAAFWEALAAGRDAIRRVERFDSSAYDVHMAAALPDGWMGESVALGDDEDPSAALALFAAREALETSGVQTRRASGRIALVLGTSAGGLASRSAYELMPEQDHARRHELLERSGFHRQTAVVARELALGGPRLTVSTACASSVHALLHARALLETGRADAVLVGGADVLVEELFAGFAAMGAMSASPCAPFSRPGGMNVGEGAAFLVVERDAVPSAVRGVIEGLGASTDAFHATAPEPTGRGIAAAITSALADADLAPRDVGYVNAHGTGTESNDIAECRGLRLALGPVADAVPVSSTKGYFGHALGAAGMLEIVATLLAMDRGVALPTLHHCGDRGGGPRDPVAAPVPREHAYDHALSLSLAFGGTNGVAVLSRRATPGSRVGRAVRTDEIVVLGVAALGGHGLGEPGSALEAATSLATLRGVDAAESLPLPARAALVPDAILDDVLQAQERRGLDRCTELMLAAAIVALRDAGLRVRGPLRERIGILAGAPRLAWGAADEFWGSIRARGFARASAPAFARLVMNAPAAAVSRALSLRGMLSVLTAGPCSGLAAFVAAGDILSTRDDVDVLLACSAFELSRGMLADHAFRFGVDGPPPGESAACFVLARASWAAAHGVVPIARLVSSFIDSPEGRACESRGHVDATFDAADMAAVFGHSEAADGLALAAAVSAVRSGRASLARALAGDPLAGHFEVTLARWGHAR